MTKPAYDWDLISLNIRTWRQARGWTQDELAKQSGVTRGTVYNLERGLPVSTRTLKKLSVGIGLQLAAICSMRRIYKSKDELFAVSRGDELGWEPWNDTRKNRPEWDDYRDPAERRRLGLLGLVSHFTTSTRFVMSDGPGLLFIELYGPEQGTINDMIYEDGVIYCMEGEVVFGVGEEEIPLSAGDAIGYVTKRMKSMVPGPDMTPDRLPVKLLWIGANRVAPLPIAAPPKKASRKKSRVMA